MGAQAGLDRIEQQQAAVGAGQLAGHRIERRRDRTARVAFTHDRFQEHRFDEPLVALGILEHLAQAGLVVRGDRNDRILATVAGQVLLVALAAGIGIQRRAVGAAMEAALDDHALDGGTGMARTRVGLQLGVDVGDARGQADRFRAGVQAHEAGERAAAAAVADLRAQGGDEALLRQAGGHDVGHHLRARHRFEHRIRGMAEAEHAVAACVVQHRALQGDHPRATRGQRHVRGHRVVGIEIDEAVLHRVDLRLLVLRQQRPQLLLHAPELVGGRFHGGNQLWVAGRQCDQGGVVQAGGDAAAGLGAEGGEAFDEAHCRSPETMGRTGLQKQNARHHARLGRTRACGLPFRC